MQCQDICCCNETLVTAVHRSFTSQADTLRRLLCYGRLGVHVNARESDCVYIACALKRVQFVVHHPAVLETKAFLTLDRGARTGREETLRWVQECLVLVLWRLVVRLIDYRQISISGASERLIRVHLHPIEMALHAVRVAGIPQQVAVHHCLIDGVVDMRLVVRPCFGEVHVAWTEDIPFAYVDGGLHVHLVPLLFPV